MAKRKQNRLKEIIAVGLIGLAGLVSCVNTNIPETNTEKYFISNINNDSILQYNLKLTGYIPRKPTVYIHYKDNKINYIYE